jgi:site-specific recombinase XerD
MPYDLIFFTPSELTQFGKETVESEITYLLKDISLSFRHSSGIALVMNDQIHWEATKYLSEISLFGRGVGGDTVRTYAESLITYLNFLEKERCDISEVSEFWIQKFRNDLIGESITRSKLSPRTINQKVSTALRFHEWGEVRNQFLSPLGKLLSLNFQGRRHNSHIKRIFRKESFPYKFLLSVEKKIPRALSFIEIQTLFKTAPLPYSLIFKLAVITGMRRMELCNLKLANIPPKLENVNRGLREIKIIRKGGKEGTVYLPNLLVDEIWWYVMKERSKPALGEDTFLFLTKDGKRIRRQYLSAVFKKCAATIAPDATLHHLRHTYAVLTLTLLQRKSDLGSPINPLKTLQVLMGHSSIESTEIYLSALDVHSEELEETLNFLYGDPL